MRKRIRYFVSSPSEVCFDLSLRSRNNSTSPRRGRQNVAPGVSPGFEIPNEPRALEEGDRSSAAPNGAPKFIQPLYPGLTPGATNMPPADAGSLIVHSKLRYIPRCLMTLSGPTGLCFRPSSFSVPLCLCASVSLWLTLPALRE